MKHWMKTDKAIEFNLESLDTLRGPGVYMYCVGDEALYVGASRKVVGRILARNHHVTRLSEATSLLIFPCNDWNAAKALETKIITDMRPSLNHRNYKMLPGKELADKLGVTAQAAVHMYLQT